MVMLKAVIFDIDGVLLDSFEDNLRYYQGFLASQGFAKPTNQQFKKAFFLTSYDVIKMFTKIKDKKQLQSLWLKSKKFPYITNHSKMPPYETTVIKWLAKKVSLALVSSRIKSSVERYVKFSKTKQHFKVRVSYEDFKHPKPNPESLRTALRKLKLKPSEAVYVGDALVDVKAAHAAGMKVILFGADKIPGADFYAKNFLEIKNIIKSLLHVP